MNDTNHKKVYAAINAVQKALKGGISKDQKNAVQGYNFRGIDDIYNVVGPLLPEHGLVIMPRMMSQSCEKHQNAKGNTLFRVTVEAEYDFIAAEDGSCHVVKMYGEAMDSGDKATNKAMSAAYKYACIQTFSIPVTGEPDADSETHEVASSGVLPSRPAQGGGQAPKTPSRGVQRQETASAEAMTWEGTINYAETNKHEGVARSGKAYTLFRVTLDDGRTATTFDEELFNKAKAIDVLHDARLRVAPNKRSSKPDTWELLDVQDMQTIEAPSKATEEEPW